MAEIKNAFIKSKMNKDLDDRLLPSGEYRDALNVQVSKSEGSDVGALENVLGTLDLEDFNTLSGATGLECIGFFADNASSKVYLFFTNYEDLNPTTNPSYSTSSSNFIYSYDTSSRSAKLLVEGSFLNFSKTNPIYGVNLLENLLFWTDDRNQPRKINVELANDTNVSNPSHYTNEDQISVAKYNPYQAIEMYAVSRETGASVDDYETTMKDVVTMFFPNGGAGDLVSSTSNNVVVNGFVGDIVLPSDNYDSGASVSYIDSNGDVVLISGVTVSAASYTEASSSWSITVTGGTLPSLSPGQKIILNANPYYNSKFSGDTNYLNDKFVRFAYRFKFEDGEYSIFSTFTQAAFIPKQDGYFMYVSKDDIDTVDDQSDAYRSTVVSFVENKVNSVSLRIPLPYKSYNIVDSLKVESIDILYKESDGLSVKVVDNITTDQITNAAAICYASSSSSSSTEVSIDNLQGGITAGAFVKGEGISEGTKVVSFELDSGSTTSGTITLSSAQTITDNTEITIGEPDYFVYNYDSKKPFKTLPSDEITRVYDKVPVRALAQEVISNRIVYGNYQDKHTPPEAIDYNVLVSEKSDFNTNEGSAEVLSIDSSNSVTINNSSGSIKVGSIATASGIPSNTFVSQLSGSVLTFSNDVSLSVSDVVNFTPSSNLENTTSIVSYPNSSLKTNRTYQVGVVLSDRYGRQSSTILSSSNRSFEVGGITYSGSTFFSPYIDDSIDPTSWMGNSMKILFNNQIGTSKNFTSGEPGIYNGDSTSENYNPLGWYSFKIVVKQTEQEYYNVYTPGVMASYPESTTLELGSTSHIVLINDNINKVPRDLSEIGPDQKLYRSSVQLFGRVENSSEPISTANPGESNQQYFPGSSNDTVSSIATLNDLFNYDSSNKPQPNFFPQFYSYESNPLIARISTSSKIGQQADENFSTSSSNISVQGVTDLLRLVNVTGDTSNIQPGDIVTGPGFPSDLKVDTGGFTDGTSGPTTTIPNAVTGDTVTLATSVNVVAGQSIVGAGIPEGTFILELTTNPISARLSNIVSVAAGTSVTLTNPATLDVTASVSVSYGDVVIVSQEDTPGIQYLSIFETKPVESLLDIFWETSTTGIVSDVNDIILAGGGESGSGGSGASGINSYNSSPFTEALWPSGLPAVYPSIFTAPIFLVDSFGQTIPSSQIESPLSIDSVFNQNGTNVQTVNSTGPYFQLVETSPGSYEYNVNITPAYTEDVYYTADAGLRSFTFNFSATVNGLITNFNETVSLINEPPFIQAPGELAPPFDEPILVENKRTTDESIIDLGGSNGSGGTTVNLFNPPPNKGEGISWAKESEVNTFGTTSNYFSVDSVTGEITNNGYQNPSMPADKYIVNVKLTDPAAFVTRDVVINLGLIVTNIEQRTITGTAAGGASYTATFFFMKVPLQPGQTYDPNNGYYIYTNGKQSTDGPWSTLIANNGGSFVIDVPAQNSPGTNCDDWKFTVSDLSGAQDFIYASQCVPTLTNYSWSDGGVLNPDPSNYTFEFV
jgi:hypothetical protein